MRIIHTDDTTLLRVEQTVFTEADVEEVTKCLKEELCRGRRKIALLIACASYPYSQLLHLFVSCHRIAQAQDAHFSVVSRSRQFDEVLEDTKLTAYLRVHMWRDRHHRERGCGS